ncbi:mitogen-activated protein kinase kinase kinase 20 [Abeliophyllum distichum]|uniref:Mitogen-activated protein kinase kinase kinase 20 n=1 Tax=Abeliophyllum distichum TaxID=126358 RepID=A0ABD1P9R1_9LAMI
MNFWRKVHVLGAGSYGTVHLAAKFDPPLSFSTAAVKSATFPRWTSLKKEGEILSQLRGCREIVHCFGEDTSFENNRDVYNLLLEYAAGGSLVNLIEKYGGNMPESMVACYCYMLLKGLSRVHGEGFVHCDIKPENILVFPSQDGTIHNLKIADFGQAKKIEEKEILIAGRSFQNRGTLLYSSPESIALGLHKPTTDIWSLGCIIVEMITGKPTWSTCRTNIELFQQIALDNPIPENISGIAKDFLDKCLAKKHKERWTADMLLNHPFIVKNLTALPPNFDNRMLLSLKNPFGTSMWASTLHMFTSLPEHERHTDSVHILYPHQLCAPRQKVPGSVRGHRLLPHQLYQPRQKNLPLHNAI